MASKKYLLDSNICIHLLRNRTDVIEGIHRVGWTNCCISELTVVELFYGAECSSMPKANYEVIETFVNSITVLPISSCIREFCRQKANLRKQGLLIEDFDMFIGCTAVVNKCTVVTENVKQKTAMLLRHQYNQYRGRE